MTTTPHETVVLAPQRLRRRPKAQVAPARSFRPDVEGLRAIAVILLVLGNAGLAVTNGAVGIDVLFVVAGFLAVNQLLTTPVTGRLGANLAGYLAVRTRRVLPAMTAVTLCSLFAVLLFGSVAMVHATGADALAGLLGTGSVTSVASPLQHLWPIAVGAQFVALAAVLVLAAVKAVGRRAARPVLAVVLTAVVVASAGWSIGHTTSPWSDSLVTRGWEPAVGALIAVGLPLVARVRQPLRLVAAVLGLGLVIASAFWASWSWAGPVATVAGPAGWAPVLGSALVIGAGCGSRLQVERFLADPLMLCLGRASYSWYLWHWPLLVLATGIAGHGLPVMMRVCVVWASLVMALISYYFVEQPPRSDERSAARTLAFWAVLVALVALGSGMLLLR